MADDIRKTLTARLEESIRVDVISGALAAEQKLPLAQLADRYDVSITPLREALQRLAQQGLVVLDAQVGARVASVSLDDAEDIYEVRLLLEPEAVERSVTRSDERWLARLTEAMDRLRTASVTLDALVASGGSQASTNDGWIAWGDAHHEFHSVLVDGCGSPRLRQFLDILHQHAERYRNLARGGGEIMRSVLAEHEHVFEVASSGDAEAAAEATADHLRLSVDILRKIIEL